MGLIMPGSDHVSHKKGPAKASTMESAPSESSRLSHLPNQDNPVESVVDSTKPIIRAISPQKLAANRENSKKSTGPKTAVGKAVSSKNAVKHSLLSKRLTSLNDQNAKDFVHVLAKLQQQLQPVGVLEEILVEKIAYEYFRTATAAQYYNNAALYVVNTAGAGPANLLRYDSMINRQLFQAINKLEALQRLRRGEDVPTPPNLQVSHDISNQEASGK